MVINDVTIIIQIDWQLFNICKTVITKRDEERERDGRVYDEKKNTPSLLRGQFLNN